jgi:DNA-binding LytR/AlgR family response regulator
MMHTTASVTGCFYFGGGNLKIAVCDDDPLELEKITGILKEHMRFNKKVDNIALKTFCSGTELLEGIQQSGGYDLLILDIVMPGLNGIDLAAKIREQDDACRIIFLTSSADFAVDSYKVKAYYYLLKSTMKNELPALLERSADEMAAETASGILIKEKYRWTRITLKNIKYVESLNHTVYFHLSNSETISSYNTINAYHDALLSDSRFIKCHKSYIVNMSYIINITGKDFILEGGALVPISRNLFGQVKDGYFDYFFKK